MSSTCAHTLPRPAVCVDKQRARPIPMKRQNVWSGCESEPWAHNSLDVALATMMPVRSSVFVKSLRVGKTFLSGSHLLSGSQQAASRQ